MFSGSSHELPERIGFLIVPRFSMMAFFSAVEPLRIANRLSGRELYSWHIFSSDGTPPCNSGTCGPIAVENRSWGRIKAFYH